MTKRFEVDRKEGKLLGVCAGLARSTGIDATFIRVGLVLAAIVGSAFWTLAAYFLVALIGQPRRGARRTPLAARHGGQDSRERMRDLDLRMQAIETYVTSSNSRLAREIEELR